MSFFNFGKSRKKTTKPPKQLLAIAKRYGVKTTYKRGSRRVWKSVATLKKECLRKARAIKKQMDFGARSSRSTRLRARLSSLSKKLKSRRSRYGEEMAFGKKGRSKVSPVQAMKAFKIFYRRHCRARQTNFGNGGNPPLWASMGTEFCSGGGGVLAGGTGLFPTPCSAKLKAAPAMRKAAAIAKPMMAVAPMRKAVAPMRRAVASIPKPLAKPKIPAAMKAKAASVAPKAAMKAAMKFGKKMKAYQSRKKLILKCKAMNFGKKMMLKCKTMN